MFLDQLIQRTFGEAATLSPRRSSRFEPTAEPGEPPAEAVQGPSAPRLQEVPSPPTVERRGTPAERIETRIVERPAKPQVVQGEPLQVVTHEQVLVPAPAVASSRPAAPPVMSERPAERREPMPTAPALVPRAPVAMEPVQQPAGETIIRERVESRLETRTIERRLESLARETHVERIERVGPTATSRPPQPPPASREAPSAEPRRSGIMPELKQAAPASPIRMEGAAPAPAPVVQITIGRVEVRAPAPAPMRQAPRSRAPKLGLEDYLQRREKP